MPYCMKCFSEREKKDYNIMKLVFTNEVGICEGCGQRKKTVIRVKKSNILLWILLVNVVLWTILFALIWDPTPKQKTPSTPEKEAYFAAMLLMQEYALKVPDTADFQPFEKVKVYTDDNNTYVVDMWIKAENSFGAKIKSNYSILVKYEPEEKQWLLINYSEE